MLYGEEKRGQRKTQPASYYSSSPNLMTGWKVGIAAGSISGKVYACVLKG
jgi:hypothetical protein